MGLHPTLLDLVAKRARLALAAPNQNGVALPPDVANATFPAQDDVLNLDGTEAIALGNRLINGRSIHGTLFYGAYYLVAFDEAQIAQNVSVLLANDD